MLVLFPFLTDLISLGLVQRIQSSVIFTACLICKISVANSLILSSANPKRWFLGFYPIFMLVPPKFTYIFLFLIILKPLEEFVLHDSSDLPPIYLQGAWYWNCCIQSSWPWVLCWEGSSWELAHWECIGMLHEIKCSLNFLLSGNHFVVYIYCIMHMNSKLS